MSTLRKAAADQACVRCKRRDGTVVGAHYTGARRLAYNGGFGLKVDDLMLAELCAECHRYMDTLSRDKAKEWEHSEEFLHYIMLTIIRRAKRGVITFNGSSGEQAQS